MECMHCGAQWVLRDGQTKLANCPFCGKALRIERTEETYTDLTEALKAIAEMKGVEALTEKPQSVLGIFLDIANELKKEFRLLKLFYENGTQKFFTDGVHTTEGQLNMAVRSLQENVFMDAGSAGHIVNVFAAVLGSKARVQGKESAGEESQNEKPRLTEGAPVRQSVSFQTKVEHTAGDSLSDGTDSWKKEEAVRKESVRETALPEGIITAESMRQGEVIELDGAAWQVIECQQVRPGRGTAYVRAKLRNISRDGVIERAFRLSEEIVKAKLDKRKMQYLYSDEGHHVFMELESYEQFDLDDEAVGSSLQYVNLNDMVTIVC